MINVTRWSPDTCACVLEFQWDSEISPDKRIHTFHNLVSACAVHQVFTGQQTYDSVLAENQNKNKTYSLVLNNFPALATIDVNGTKSLQAGKMSYFFDSARVLNIVIALTAIEKTVLQTLADSTLGAGKVKII